MLFEKDFNEQIFELLNTEVQKAVEDGVMGFVTDFIETGMYEGVNSIEDIMKLWRKYEKNKN